MDNKGRYSSLINDKKFYLFASVLIVIALSILFIFAGNPFTMIYLRFEAREYAMEMYQIDIDVTKVSYNFKYRGASSSGYTVYATDKNGANPTVDNFYIKIRKVNDRGSYYCSYPQNIIEDKIRSDIKDEIVKLNPTLVDFTVKYMTEEMSGDIVNINAMDLSDLRYGDYSIVLTLYLKSRNNTYNLYDVESAYNTIKFLRTLNLEIEYIKFNYSFGEDYNNDIGFYIGNKDLIEIDDLNEMEFFFSD